MNTAEKLNPQDQPKTMLQIQNEMYEMLTAFQDTLEGMEEPDEMIEFKAVMEPILVRLSAEEADKADNIAFAYKRAAAEVDFLKAEKKNIDNRIKSANNRLDRFRDYIRLCMVAGGEQKIKGHIHTLFLRKTESVELTEDFNGEQQYHENPQIVKQVVTYSPDKKAIKEAIKAGISIDGAGIKETTSLTIR